MRTRLLTFLLLLTTAVSMPTVVMAVDGGTRSPGEDAGAAAAGGGVPFPVALDQTLRPKETSVEVGEPIELELRIEHPRRTEVELPETFGTQRWELLRDEREDLPAEGKKTTIFRLTFAIYRPGKTTLPAFPLTVVDDEGNTAEISTEPVTARVVSILQLDEGEPSFLPARPPIAIWVEDYTLAWAGGLAGSALLVGLLMFLALRRKDLAEEMAPPPRPAHVVALEKLSALAGDDLVERGEYMFFYVRLSEAIREYLGRRYGFKGTELTTTEILDELDDVTWPNGISWEDVSDFLRHCDLVKFSGRVPSPEEANSSLRRAFAIVELTQPRQEETESSGDRDARPGADEAARRDTEETRGTEDDSPQWAPSSGGDKEEDDRAEDTVADATDDGSGPGSGPGSGTEATEIRPASDANSAPEEDA